MPTRDRLEDARGSRVRTSGERGAMPTARAAAHRRIGSGRSATIVAGSVRDPVPAKRTDGSERMIKVPASAGLGRRRIARGNDGTRVAPNGDRGTRRREVRVPARARTRREQIAIARPAIVRRAADRPRLLSIRGAGSSQAVHPASDDRLMPGPRARIGGHSIRGVHRTRRGRRTGRGRRSSGRGRRISGVRSRPAARLRIGEAAATGERRPAGRSCPRPRPAPSWSVQMKSWSPAVDRSRRRSRPGERPGGCS